MGEDRWVVDGRLVLMKMLMKMKMKKYEVERKGFKGTYDGRPTRAIFLAQYVSQLIDI